MSEQQDRFVQHQGADKVYLEAALTGDVSSAIERQEKQGQSALVAASNLLPKHIQAYGPYRAMGWEQFAAAWGLTVVGSADDIFNLVLLADGWKIMPTDHSMWTKLVDDQGRERAAIFYKAAFYDRNAHIHPLSRYTYEHSYDKAGKVLTVQVKDRADGTAIHVLGSCANDDYEASNKLDEAARAWLDEHYPDYPNPLAYW